MPMMPDEACRTAQGTCDTSRASFLVLGLGNILLRDEGIGVRVVQHMQDASPFSDVEFVDGATAGMDLLDILADRERVVVVDAIGGDLPPGTVTRLTPEDLTGPNEPGASLHELGLLDALVAARRLGCAPRELVIIGVRPFDVAPGLELSDRMAALVPPITSLIEAEFKRRHTRECSAERT